MDSVDRHWIGRKKEERVELIVVLLNALLSRKCQRNTRLVCLCVPCSLSPQLGVVDGAGEAEGAECTARKEKSLGKQEHTCCLRGE
jgi:hypothetical protein